MQALGVKMHNVFRSLSGVATFSTTTHTHTHTHRKQRPSFTRTWHSTNIKPLDRGLIRNRGSMEGSGNILFQSKLGVRNSRMGERQLLSEHFRIPHTSNTFKNCAELGGLRFSSAFKAIYSKVIKSKWSRCPHCTTSLHSYIFNIDFCKEESALMVQAFFFFSISSIKKIFFFL